MLDVLIAYYSAEVEEILRENRHLKTLKACKICLESTSGVLLIPCGHLYACETCFKIQKNCWICHFIPKGYVKVHFARMSDVSDTADSDWWWSLSLCFACESLYFVDVFYKCSGYPFFSFSKGSLVNLLYVLFRFFHLFVRHNCLGVID